MIKIKTLTLLMLLLLPVHARAAITSTSQDLDEFSFGKGLKMNGSLTTGNTFHSDSLMNRESYVIKPQLHLKIESMCENLYNTPFIIFFR